LVTVDEGGGFYDSGFIQPVDFFGTGPRIPMIAVSPFSTGGHISHVYSEHSSFVKLVERNWMLNTTLSDRSRDNLPNPDQKDHSYVPRNMPAIGDLFDLFDFGKEVIRWGPDSLWIAPGVVGERKGMLGVWRCPRLDK